MVRNNRRKALYEVMGKTAKCKPVEPLRTPTIQQKPVEPPVVRRAESETRWPNRPKLVQFNNGRVEITVPWQLAVSLLLAFAALVLVAYRLGQMNYEKNQGSAVTAKTSEPFGTVTPGNIPPSVAVPKSEDKKPVQPAVPPKGNRIVIKQHTIRKDLEPVLSYFAQNGIETFIEQRVDRFFLLTKGTYDNPNKTGTDGYAMKQKIVDIGDKYKAPQNSESFAPGFFRDAYGEKVK